MASVGKFDPVLRPCRNLGICPIRGDYTSLNPKTKNGIVIGAAVLAGILIYEYVAPTDSPDVPNVSTSIKVGAAAATALGVGWLAVAIFL
jgi:hypothetical protein